jgi:RHS repeat-associated protein
VYESYRYDAFGRTTILNAYDQPISYSTYMGTRIYGFTGREYDCETGLYYYRARYYNPAIGRFLQTDPIGYADSLNLYQYCGNNPVRWKDPSGKGLTDSDSSNQQQYINSPVMTGSFPNNSNVRANADGSIDIISNSGSTVDYSRDLANCGLGLGGSGMGYPNGYYNDQPDPQHPRPTNPWDGYCLPYDPVTTIPDPDPWPSWIPRPWDDPKGQPSDKDCEYWKDVYENNPYGW